MIAKKKEARKDLVRRLCSALDAGDLDYVPDQQSFVLLQDHDCGLLHGVKGIFSAYGHKLFRASIEG